MFTHTIKDEVYGSFIVLMTGDRAEIKAKALEYDPAFDGDMDFKGRSHDFKGPSGFHHVLVMLPEWTSSTLGRIPTVAEQMSTLVHELFHATEQVMWYHDIDHTEETQEAWAYFLDSLVRRALEILP